MANTKFTGLTNQTTPLAGDIFPFITDPGGTPTPKKVTFANIEASLTVANQIGGASTGTGNIVRVTSPTLVTPVLGVATATSINGNTVATGTGTLTLSTFTLTVAGTASVSGTNTGDNTVATALTGTPNITVATVTTTGNIELGDALDTTLSRSAAGVLAVEGVVIPSISSTNTITNKRIPPRIVSATSYTTDTGSSFSFATADEFIITAQAGALLFNNPGGSPTEGEKITVRIKDNGTNRALTYDTQFRALGNALPTSTTANKTLYMGFIWNATDTKLDLVAVALEA